MWNNLVIEVYCFGKEDRSGCYPCGRMVTSAFCLGRHERCPHMAWCESSEREAACYVPFSNILKDKVTMWAECLWLRFRWIFWDSLWFNRRKVDEFFASIPIEDENSDLMKEIRKEETTAQKRFVKWFNEKNSG